MGAAFSLLGIVAKLIDLISKPLYGFVYSWSLAMFPGLWLAITAAVFMVILSLLVKAHFNMKRVRNNLLYEQIESGEEEIVE